MKRCFSSLLFGLTAMVILAIFHNSFVRAKMVEALATHRAQTNAELAAA